MELVTYNPKRGKGIGKEVRFEDTFEYTLGSM
jgi:hypothetical protein